MGFYPVFVYPYRRWTLANSHDITDRLYWPVMIGHNSWYFIDGISLASDNWTLLMIRLSSPILTSILDHDWNRDVRYGPTSRMRLWPSNTFGTHAGRTKSHAGRTKSSTSETSYWLMTLPSSDRELLYLPRGQWSLLNSFRPDAGPCRNSMHEWGYIALPRWDCGEHQTTRYIVDLLRRRHLRTTPSTGWDLQLAAETKPDITKIKR